MNNRRGFTLVELLVAISITVLMLMLVGRIFMDTTRAVSTGIGLGRVIDASRVVSDQLERDTKNMLKPNGTPATPAGFIVILNRRLAGQAITLPDGTDYVESIRDDQLVFIAAATGGDSFHPLCPATEGSFSTGFTGAYARVWYGHALRTEANGADPAGDLGTAENRNVAQGVLGRQAMLLDITPAGPPGIYANGARWNSPVVGYATLPQPPTSPDVVFRGLTDLSNQTILGALADLAGVGYPGGAYNYTFGADRLRYNPPANRAVSQSWQVAQGHAALMDGVSDFEVSFAADITHSGYSVDIPTGDTIFGLDVDGGGNLIWYDMDTPAATFTGATPAFTPYDNSPGLALASHAFTFQHADDAPWSKGPPVVYGSQWPHMIRIRYRLHDMKGGSFHTDTARLTDAIDNDGNGTVDDAGESKVPGMWFEQIIKVNRD